MNEKTTFRTWATLAPFSDFQMQVFSRPEKVGKKTTPENLNELTIGQLIDLSAIGGGMDMFVNVCAIILHMQPKEVYKSRATEVVRFVGWVLGEVEKINKLFEGASGEPNQWERLAGIDKLNFGLFGMLDYYALRMGYTNHDDVLQVKWTRIYKCIDIDNKKKLFQRRLQEVMANEHRRAAY